METIIVVLMLVVFGGFAALFVWAQRSARQRSEMFRAFARERGFTYEAEVAKGSVPPFGRHLCFFGGVRRLSDVIRGEHRRVRFWFADAHTSRKHDSINSFVAVAVEGDHPEIYVLPAELPKTIRAGIEMLLPAFGLSALEGRAIGIVADVLILGKSGLSREQVLPYQDLVRDAGDDAFALMPGWLLLFPRERTKHRDFGAMIDLPEQLSALLDKAVSLRSASVLS